MSDEEQSEKLKKAQSLYQDIHLTQKMQTLKMRWFKNYKQIKVRMFKK